MTACVDPTCVDGPFCANPFHESAFHTILSATKSAPIAATKQRQHMSYHDAFTRWLGGEYDLTALDAVMSAAAAEQLDGDPVWLMVISGSGNAKTETVSALRGIGAHVTSSISSDAALLSGTQKRDIAKDATGGMLRVIGDRGLLVIKDFTTILSMNREVRGTVLAALREVYDGYWQRNMGGDGGRTLTWEGRIVVVGAATTAYDQAHAVISAMGDRFALVRMDSTRGRMSAGRQALDNIGKETEMRRELSDAVSACLRTVRADVMPLDEVDSDELLRAADIVTSARTAIVHDFKGEPIEAHAPEMPTRFAKMLGQVLRGGMALGMSRERAREVALRVARDSLPPMRALVLADVLGHPATPTADVVKRVQRPRTSVDRTLQELHLIELVEVTSGPVANRWYYEVAAGVDLVALKQLLTTGSGS